MRLQPRSFLVDNAGLQRKSCTVRRSWHLGLMATVALVCCGPRSALDASHASALSDSVRGFMSTVSSDVTSRGPAAWRTHFAQEPAFFMAAEGRLVFPNSEAATQAITTLTRTIARIELRWTAPVRVDPLAAGLAVVAAPYHETRVDNRGRRVEEYGFFTGLVESRGTAWQFRDAHWSVVAPAPAVP